MKTILSFTLFMIVVVVTNGQILFTNDSIFIDGKFSAIHTSILKPSSKVDSSDAIMMFAPISKSNKKIIKSTIGNPNQAPYRKHKESVVIHFIGATNDSNKILLAGYYLEESGVMQNNALLTTDQVYELISSIIYLTISVISWWFGDRALAKYNSKRA
jgi:hypothetical protein